MSMDHLIELELVGFLRDVFASHDFDYVVPVERKGTAVWRVLHDELEPEEARVGWPWDKVLATSAIDFIDPDRLKGKRILLFDDMVHHGSNLEAARKQLLSHQPEIGEIVPAGFAVHETCARVPQHYFYRALATESYHEVRHNIIDALQRFGSLLLDTEHVEVSVAPVSCSTQMLFSALARAGSGGDVIEFRSGRNRKNLTIANPMSIDDPALEALLPPGTDKKNVVRKCRVVQRKGGEFAVIPIFYPTVPVAVDSSWYDNLPGFVRTELLCRDQPKQPFYIAGLLSALELLKPIAGALHQLQGKVEIKVRQSAMDHLLSVYPFLDTRALTTHILKMFESTTAKEYSKRLKESALTTAVSDEDLAEYARLLLKEIPAFCDQRSVDARYPEEARAQRKGASLPEIIDLADRLEISRPCASAALDRLIDDGYIVTNVERARSRSGPDVHMRTFTVDGEVIASLVHRENAVNGRRLEHRYA